MSDDEKVLSFLKRSRAHGIESTDAFVVDVKEEVYNVIGSSDGLHRVPNHIDETWKNLLKAYRIGSECYVTNSGKLSHPGFDAGGQLTTSRNGEVREGGTSYLMPLCY